MGRNGSGKTTLLKLAMGLLRPDHGRVLIDGQEVGKRSTVELARTVGYLPQNAGSLLFNDSVAEELRFTLRCRGRTDNLDALLERFDVVDLAARNPLDLSGGERLRAALAAVLAGRPSVLLLDEPTRGVDAALKERLGRLFRGLANDGLTVILATHDVDMVAEFADRIVILGDGDIIADGAPHDVMPGSLIFSTQINRVFGGRLLTPRDVEEGFKLNGA
jgi:energy-coupling factor transport system ATP-binding protein